MSFVDAVKKCFSNYVTFEGRAARSEYWWWFLFILIVNLALGSLKADTLGGLFSLATLLPSFAVGCRRLHDIGKSGWWQLIWLIPFIGWLILIYWLAKRSDGDNSYGPALAV